MKIKYQNFRVSIDTLLEFSKESFNSTDEEGNIIEIKNMSNFHWDKERDKVFVQPLPLEAFLRSFLSVHLSGDRKVFGLGDLHDTECETSANCGLCNQGLSGFASARKECLLGSCICPAAFYHLALDIGNHL